MSEDGIIRGFPGCSIKVPADKIVQRRGERDFKILVTIDNKQQELVWTSAFFNAHTGRWWGVISKSPNATVICYWRAKPPSGVKIGARIRSWLPVSV